MATRRQDSWDTLEYLYTTTPPTPPTPPTTQAQLQKPATTTNYSAIADFLWIGRRSRSIPQFIPPLISDDQVQLQTTKSDTLQTIELKLDKHLMKLSSSTNNIDPTCTAASATTICHPAAVVLSPSPHPPSAPSAPSAPPAPPAPPAPSAQAFTRPKSDAPQRRWTTSLLSLKSATRREQRTKKRKRVCD